MITECLVSCRVCMYVYRERIRVNGELISETDVVNFGHEVLHTCGELGIKPNFFEITYAMVCVQLNQKTIFYLFNIDMVAQACPYTMQYTRVEVLNHKNEMTDQAGLYFRRQACDVVVLETGMGGRLDPTNTCQPITT